MLDFLILRYLWNNAAEVHLPLSFARLFLSAPGFCSAGHPPPPPTPNYAGPSSAERRNGDQPGTKLLGGTSPENVSRIPDQPQYLTILSPSPTSTADFAPPSSSGQHGLTPLSSPGACLVEWFESHGNSLGLNLVFSQTFPPLLIPNSPITSGWIPFLVSLSSPW